jgi:hypothetical protein
MQGPATASDSCASSYKENLKSYDDWKKLHTVFFICVSQSHYLHKLESLNARSIDSSLTSNAIAHMISLGDGE